MEIEETRSTLEKHPKVIKYIEDNCSLRTYNFKLTGLLNIEENRREGITDNWGFETEAEKRWYFFSLIEVDSYSEEYDHWCNHCAEELGRIIKEKKSEEQYIQTIKQ